MNKTEILNIVNEPSKHIQIVKIDGKDSIVYSSKFVEFLESVSEMFTKADMVAMLTDIQLEIAELPAHVLNNKESIIRMEIAPSAEDVYEVIQQKINALTEGTDDR